LANDADFTDPIATAMTEVQDLVRYCDDLLDAARFADYAPNGLQVEGERSDPTSSSPASRPARR
jgi:hypothetical protein